MQLDLQLQRGAYSLDARCDVDAPVAGLFGPSGAGKSSLLGMLAGFIRPHSGRLAVDGTCLFDSARHINVPVHERRIGMVFQESRLFPHLTVQDNLNYGYRLLPARDRRFQLRQIVDLLEIDRLLQHKPNQLSGGEKQRVALGRALLTSPRLLLLDEPLASLDVRLKHQILPFLRRVKHEIEIPMVYVSHAIDEILYLTSQLVILDQGRILGSGPFHEVMQDARVLGLAHSLGLENVLHVDVVQHSPQYGYTLVALGRQELYIPLVEAALGSMVSVSIAAANIALSRQPLSGVTIQNQLAGVVTEIRQVGTKVLVTVDTGSLLIAEITAKALADMAIAPGMEVHCLIKTQSLRPLALSVSAQA